MTDNILRVLIFIAGGGIAIFTVFSAIKSFVLPRGVSDWVSGGVFALIRLVLTLPLQFARTYNQRDWIMAFYAPISLLVLVPVWYTFIILGYAVMYWSLGIEPWYEALILSGSSLLTLGFIKPIGAGATLLSFSEATLGLILVALLIAYLPTMYAAFSRRESAVTLLEVRAGSPPTAVKMILRYNRIHGLEHLSEQWQAWEIWFAEINESHTSLPPLVFFRSPQSEHSWVTAAGAILDAAALTRSTIDIPTDPQADLCIRAGFLALRNIADFFGLVHNPDPHYPDDPISLTRAEFEQACEELAAAGIPLKSELDQAWFDFAGWRVNYDAVLLSLVTLTMAPKAPWSSDQA